MDGSRRQQRRKGSPAAAAGRPRTVPIAVTPEGFWCCPSPAALHKSLVKNPHHHHHPHAKHAPPAHKTSSAPPSRAPSVQTAPSVTDDPAPAVTDDQQHHNQSQATTETPAPAPAPDGGQQQEPPPPQQQQQHKVCVGFGRPETSDLTVMLYGKEGIAVRMSVHSDVLSQSSAFFAHRLSAGGGGGPGPAPNQPCVVEIHDCDDAEMYVETVGLMYCDEAKHRLLLKQESVPRVLRIIKAADALGFRACVTSCLHYLEAVPWVGDEEERSVVSSIRCLQSKDRDKDDGCCNYYYGGVVSPLLKRVAASDDCLRPPSDTFASITEMVLTSTDDRGRREMKALVLNLLKDSSRSSHVAGGDGSPPDDDISSAETLYASCRGCLDRLRELFAEASSSSSEPDYYCPAAVTRRIALETDNLLWLVEMLVASQRAGDGFVALWSRQAELAASHARVPAPSRHAVSRVTARLFVCVGRGELLPPRDARLRLLQVWLHPLIDDYAWLQRGNGGGGSRPSSSASAAFDRRLVEDGIGQTILTLPLEDQRSILLAWFGRFLKLGDDCPNLLRAFEVWWRRTFVRPYVLHQRDSDAGDVMAIR